MTRQTPKKDHLSAAKKTVWSSTAQTQSATANPEARRQLMTLQDRTSDMATLGQMLARIRSERS